MTQAAAKEILLLLFGINKEVSMLFDDKNEKQLKEILENYRKSTGASFEFTITVDSELNNEEKRIINPKSLYCKCVLSIIQNMNISSGSYLNVLNYAKNVYRQLFPLDEQSEHFDLLSKIYVEMFDNTGFIATQCFDIKFLSIFYNLENYYKWMVCVDKNHKFAEIKDYIYEYGIEARAFFANEESFTSNYIYVCEKMLKSENTEEVFNKMKKDVEHMAGIYDVEEAMLSKVEQDIATAQETITRADDILAVIEKRIKNIDQTTLSAVERVKRISDNEVALAQATLNDIDVRLQSAYDDFLHTQKQRIVYEKDKLVEQVVTESEGKLNEFKENVRSVISMAKFEVSKINNEVNITMQRLKDCMADDEKVNAILKDSVAHDELIKKIEKLTILNDSNMELLNYRLEQEIEKMPASAKVNSAKKTVKKIEPQEEYYPENETERQITDYEDIPDVNPLLDENVPFSKRFEMAMDNKKRLEDQGEHFHEKFNDVLTAVMENANPYLIGPTGCGKTYMVHQLCRILNMSFIDIGYINEEYDILGFQTANGGYSRPNFYRCYKYGKIAFCDELDNGNSRATVKLNSFLGNTNDAGFNFPNGEFVKRHGNFRIIAAGNTAGNGADSNYNTREKIEESVQQRFTPIYVGYDNEIERAIIGQYTAIFEFIVHFREATNAWSRKSHMSASGIITTRDTARIRKYLDNNSFSVEKILDYEFIQTKDEVYLGFLADYMKANVKEEDASFNIINSFCEKVEAIRNGDIIR